MKSTGIVRKVDELGRVVIPRELRNSFDINIKDPIEIYVDGDLIILKKYLPDCIFCGETENVVNYKNRNICSKCIKELNEKNKK